MSVSTIPKPVNESELWKKELSTWTNWVSAKTLRFGYDIDSGRVILEACFVDGDVRRIAWGNGSMTYSYRHNDTWSLIATWNKTS